MTPFANEPLVNFRQPENAAAMRAAIEKVRANLGREYDLVIGSRRSRTSEKIQSTNPAHPEEVVGVHQKAGLEHVEPAMQAALAAFESWKNVSPEDRAALVFRVAEILRRRKFEFNAWMIFEIGKNWSEARTVRATIDF